MQQQPVVRGSSTPLRDNALPRCQSGRPNHFRNGWGSASVTCTLRGAGFRCHQAELGQHGAAHGDVNQPGQGGRHWAENPRSRKNRNAQDQAAQHGRVGSQVPEHDLRRPGQSTALPGRAPAGSLSCHDSKSSPLPRLVSGPRPSSTLTVPSLRATRPAASKSLR